MPKLLIVTTVAATLKAFLLPYARRFGSLGWQVDGMARDASRLESDDAASFRNVYDVPFSRKPWELRDVRGMNERIRSLAVREGYDIVHVHTPVAAFVTRRALGALPRARRPAIVYTVHGFHFFAGGPPLKNLAYRSLERLASRWTDHTIVINDEDYRAALRYKIAPPEGLTLLPGVGLDFARYSPLNHEPSEVAKVRASLGLTEDDVLFSMVAEFNKGKRHKDAVAALAATGRRDLHLALAGEGPLAEDTRRQAEALGVAAHVHFLGRRPDVPLLMLASRATVLPSEREGLNRSVMESLCLGVPVLGADSRGIRELVTSPERGSLVPVGNATALAAAMILAADDPCPIKPTPDPRWNIEHLLKEHERLYGRLLSLTPPTSV